MPLVSEEESWHKKSQSLERKKKKRPLAVRLLLRSSILGNNNLRKIYQLLNG